MIHLKKANNLGELAHYLGDTTSVLHPDCLAPEVISVQSNGMARWLAMELARQRGVAANMRFPFPASLIWELMGSALGMGKAVSGEAYQSSALTWRIYRLLEQGSEFPEVSAYLLVGSEANRYQLATRIASVFDQYLVYRPDWILAWEDGEGSHWQARLWRALVAEIGADVPHRAHLLRRFQEQVPWGLADAAEIRARIPEHIALFGIPSLPPAYLDVLGRIGQLIPVHIYQLTPTREYAADLLPPETLAERSLAGAEEAPFLEAGHPLVASLGRQWAEFQGMIQDYTPEEAEAFSEPGLDSVLAVLHSDIHSLRHRHPGPGADAEPLPGPAPDSPGANLALHACHSPLREVEVLFDQLLALFEAFPDLRPADIVVMTPDIDAYTPFIESVFGHPDPGHGPSQGLPFRIADQGLRARSAVVDAAFRLLELPDGRYGVNAILDLLDQGPIRETMGLSEPERDRIRQWIQDTGIRWGIDGAFRAEQGLPNEAAHTWLQGLDRLLLGYALPGDGDSLYDDLLPHGEAEGGWALTLGRFQAYVRDLFRWHATLTQSHTPQEWAAHLRAFLQRFLQPADPEQASDLDALFGALASLEAAAEAGETAEPIPRAVAVQELEAHLSLDIEGTGYLGHGITFCAMMPMRAIPFEVVALIGLNDGSFPRIQQPVSFDRMADQPRPGDRSRREDDRYLFLETQLSARRYLHISYVGRDSRADSPRPPSVLVSELCDTLDEAFQPGADGQPYSAVLTTHHPLQPFSPRYFAQQQGQGAPLFSYSPVLRDAAVQIQAQQDRAPAPPPPFLGQPLPEAEADWRTVTVADLIRFFRGPAQFLLANRLGVALDTDEEELIEEEPFTLTSLDAHQVRERIFAYGQRHGTTVGALERVRAEGLLPHGTAGELAYQGPAEDAEALLAEVARLPEPAAFTDVPIDLKAGPIRITGVLPAVPDDGWRAIRCGRLNEGFALETAIRHRLLCAQAPAGIAHQTRVLTTTEDPLTLPALDPETARAELAELGAAFWEGLHWPLPFPLRAAWAYAREADEGKAWKAATKIWYPDDWNPASGEDQEPYHRLAYAGRDPLDEERDRFTHLADLVFRPIAEQLAP